MSLYLEDLIGVAPKAPRVRGSLGALPAPDGLDPITYGMRYTQQLRQIFLPILIDLYRRGAAPAEVQQQAGIILAREGLPSTWFSALQDLAPVAQAFVKYGDRLKELEPVFPTWLSESERQPYRDQYIVLIKQEEDLKAIGRAPIDPYGRPLSADVLNKLVDLKNSPDIRRGNINRAAEIGRMTLSMFAALDAHQLTMTKKRIEQVYNGSAGFREVIESIPWPHPWIREFAFSIDPVNYPVPTPFYRDIPLWDYQGLLDAGYFKNAKVQMEHDIAVWLKDNVATMAQHFQKKLEYWIGQQEGKAKEGVVPAMMSFVKGVLFIAGVAASFLLPAVGQLIVTAVKSSFDVLRASLAGKQQIEMAGEVLRLVGTTSTAFETFTNWIGQRLAPPPKPVGFSIKVEGQVVGQALTMKEAIEIAMAGSVPGDRVEFVHQETGATVLRIRTTTTLMDVPKEMEAKVRLMSKQELHGIVEAAEQKMQAEKGGFPWWIMIPIGGAIALLA